MVFLWIFVEVKVTRVKFVVTYYDLNSAMLELKIVGKKWHQYTQKSKVTTSTEVCQTPQTNPKVSFLIAIILFLH